MKYIKLSLTAAICMMAAIIVLCLPHRSYSAGASYTIQIGSYTSINNAQNAFNSTVKQLSGKDLTHLRIEKIANFYSVRLGKFGDSESAEKFLKKNRSKLANAIAKKAYINKDRIIKLYDPSLKKKSRVAKKKKRRFTKKPAPVTAPKKSIPKAPEETPDRTEALAKKKAKPEPDYPPKKPQTKIIEKAPPEKIRVISELITQKEYKKALGVIKAEIAKEPESPELNGWYGAVLLMVNSPEKALKPLKKATELSPDLPDYHSVTGYCLFFLNRLDEAIIEFNKTITLDPSHIDALAGLGTTYAKIGKREKASEIHRKLQKIDSRTAEKLLKVIKKDSL